MLDGSDIRSARLKQQLRRLASEEFREFREDVLEGARRKALNEMQDANPHLEVPRLQGKSKACEDVLKLIEQSMTPTQQPDLKPETWS